MTSYIEHSCCLLAIVSIDRRTGELSVPAVSPIRLLCNYSHGTQVFTATSTVSTWEERQV